MGSKFVQENSVKIKLPKLCKNYFVNPCTKVTGCLCVCVSVYLCVCVSVLKDLANRCTDQVLLNRVASHTSREGL